MGKVRILVIGGTGRQGGGTIDALLAKGGFEIYMMSRNPNAPRAQELEARGVTLSSRH